MYLGRKKLTIHFFKVSGTFLVLKNVHARIQWYTYRKRNVIKVLQSHYMWCVKKRRAHPLGEGSVKRKRLILG